MAAEKNITSRIQQKHDTAANWAKATTFIPKKGEIVIYDAEYNTSGVQTQAVRFKIGDGSRTINNLPFALIDPDNLAKLDTENTFTAKQTINSGYGAVSLKTQGYVEIGASYASKSDIGGLYGFKDDSTGRIYAINPRDLGFVERIKMNNSSIEPGDTGTVDLGTVLTAHQNIKILNTNNTTSQTASASEALSGSGTINLHKVAKTGSYNDLLNKPNPVTESTVSSWGFTKNTGTVTSVAVKMNGATKGTVTSSGTIDLGTVITSHQDISGLMPKSGGTFTGNISVPKTITFTDNTNPFIKMTTGGTDFYFQSTSGMFGLGPTWDKATHWDSNGNVTFPTVPKVGSTALALVSQIPTFELSGDTLIINF